ncbi:MAG: transporter substrate-binding domain-containing protein [Gammaproteobacteria bacterium]|jgi:polar amino acid transport system substrate-binding protein|nr:transporter substrate-binding domain-containing protein [Gammaproteobacteria bacterium]MBU2179521.1 transporter substrate-binding domain-containing protein [Gammaproteobacteria bacterium]MBU2225904.1 transporter substrate-binding domain-containing protein [Gammaproteobacteria bacterium]MBU2277284.1 transporter substrate-binding domain-containing protein [Gammaproteobacteria bacterium]MBU2425542.1 transporter substrate-binding domain-containing protein [Gammaproteobacteria bacterium]
MKSTIALFVFFLILNSSVAAQEQILLAAEDAWYPYSAKIGREVKGRSVDIVKAAYKAIGAELTLDVIPFNRGFIRTKDGHYAGVFNAGVNDEVKRNYLIPRNTIALSEQVVVARSGESFQNKNSFNHKRLILTLGYTYPTDITDNPRNQIDRTVGDVNCLRMVAAGRSDFTIIDRLVFLSLLQNEPELRQKLTIVGNLEPNKIYVLFSKNDVGKRALLLFDRGMDIIARDGTLKEIEDTWESKLR